MTHNPKLEDMGETIVQKNRDSENMNGLQYSNAKSDSFVVDMERFSHITEKDINANSRITLQRNLSRKGSLIRGSEKKINSITNNERDTCLVSTSPRATLHGGNITPEKPAVVGLGPTDHSTVPQIHQITITNGNTTPESNKLSGKRSSFRRSTSTWTIDPRKILFFFATLSCMGTVLLIYCTLSISKHNGDDNTLEQ